MTEVTRILMQRDGLSFEEAEEVRQEMIEAVMVYGEDPEDVLYDEGLEPDYIFELLR